MRSSSVFVFVITCGRGSVLFRRRCYTSCARAVKEVGRFAAVYTFEKALVRSHTDHYSVSKKISRWGFLTILPKTTENFKIKFGTLLYIVHTYVKLQKFIQLPITLINRPICLIKRDHLVNFYVSPAKRENCDISATVWPISTKFDPITQNGSLERSGRPPSWIFKIKNFNGRCTWQTLSASSDFVDIGHTVAEILWLSVFQWNMQKW